MLWLELLAVAVRTKVLNEAGSRAKPCQRHNVLWAALFTECASTGSDERSRHYKMVRLGLFMLCASCAETAGPQHRIHSGRRPGCYASRDAPTAEVIPKLCFLGGYHRFSRRSGNESLPGSHPPNSPNLVYMHVVQVAVLTGSSS